MTGYVDVWQCIGCGKIEAPQPCIGVCKDRKVRLVDAAEYERALARLAVAQMQVSDLALLLTQLAHTHPRPGQWESSYRRFQGEAQRLIANLEGAGQ